MPLMIEKECTLVLHNIRSVHNVGSLFRASDGAGVFKIILTGYTPGPLDHKGKPRKDLAKVALGAENSISWERSEESLEEVIEKLRKEGNEILALECEAGAQNIFTFTPKNKFALILGNEVDGVAPSLLKNADTILEIPMKGVKSSLNVSVAGGVALYALLRE